MYENLKVELSRANISQREIAKYLGVHENSVGNKIGKGSFSIEEAFKIKGRFFPALELSYLFRNTSSTQ